MGKNRQKKKENSYGKEIKNTTTNNDIEKSKPLIKTYRFFIFVFGLCIIFLLCEMFSCYDNDSDLPPMLLNGYFTITFSILSFFISCYIYGKQDEPKTEKEKKRKRENNISNHATNNIDKHFIYY